MKKEIDYDAELQRIEEQQRAISKRKKQLLEERKRHEAQLAQQRRDEMAGYLYDVFSKLAAVRNPGVEFTCENFRASLDEYFNQYGNAIAVRMHR